MAHPEHAEHERLMIRAVALAERGRGRVEPNPPVGAVIVRDGRVVGEGYHQRFGGAHAEINAMVEAGDCRGAILYVTLSPCNSLNKKTPPCSDAVLKAGFRTLIIGFDDPTHPSAMEQYKAAGINVIQGVAADHCHRLVAPFLKLRLQGLPWVISKWAMTADGKTATTTGDSRWISCEESRKLVHEWRNQVDAVMIGSGTAERDNPELTCRLPNGRNPLRIILDSSASLSASSKLVATAKHVPLLVACTNDAPAERRTALEKAGCRVVVFPSREGRVDIPELLRSLGKEQLTNLLVEGGAHVHGEMMSQGLVDEARIFIAPKLVGGRTASGSIGGAGVLTMAHAWKLEQPEWRAVGTDMLLVGRVHSA